MTVQPTQPAQTPPIEPPPEPPDLAVFLASIAAFTAASEALRINLFGLIGRFFRLVSNPYDTRQIEQYSTRVAQVTRAAQQQQMDLAIAHQRQLMVDAGVRLPRFTSRLPERPRGVDPVEVAERALREVRYLRSIGLDEATSNERGLERAVVMHGDDVDQAKVEGFKQAYEHAPPQVIGYRRVIHPEMSKTGTCGLCVAASTRAYYLDDDEDTIAKRREQRRSTGQERRAEAERQVEENKGKKDLPKGARSAILMPIHTRCSCSASPITEDQDLGDLLNTADLEELYKLAGQHTTRTEYEKDANGKFVLDAKGQRKVIKASKTLPATSREALNKVRFTVEEHGELGSRLRSRSKGADDPAARIAQIDTTSKGLGVWAEKTGIDLQKAIDTQLDHRNDEKQRQAAKPGTGR